MTSLVKTTVVDHPLAAARLAALRDERTNSANFRASLAELSTMLVYEATRDFATETYSLDTPVGPTSGVRLSSQPLLVPVLRAGLGMANAAFGLLPEAQMGFVGVVRDEETALPHAYMESLPVNLAGRPVVVLDPMVATGGSLIHALRLLTERAADDITVVCVLAAPEGLAALEAARIPLRLFTASIDERLNDAKYIVPGLGDAGDRQFGSAG